MLFNSSKAMFLATMIFGVMLSISSNNWMMMWAGMEITLISFIPLMTKESISSSESTMKLFIIQSVSSSLMMMSIMMMMMYKTNFMTMLIISLIMKTGMAPFQAWMISIIEGMEKNNLFHLLITIKIPPMVMMSYISSKMEIIAMLTLFMGSFLALNQSSVNKMITYSSVYNMGYIVSVMMEYTLWISYMLVYALMLQSILVYMKKKNMSFINQSSNLTMTMSSKMFFWFMMLSLGGMPPTSGFMIKVMVLETMMLSKEFMTITIMILSSLIMMFCYTRLAFSSMMMFNMKMKWNYTSKDSSKMFLLMLSVLLMPILILMKSIK